MQNLSSSIHLWAADLKLRTSIFASSLNMVNAALHQVHMDVIPTLPCAQEVWWSPRKFVKWQLEG
jgi:hypothetical protein